MSKNKLGVSLAELLAVVVIMGIIAAIAVPLVGRLIEDSRRDALKGDAYAIADAARLYCLTNSDNVGCHESQQFNLLSVDGKYDNPNFQNGYIKKTDDRSGNTGKLLFNPENSAEVASRLSKEFTSDDYYNVYYSSSTDVNNPFVRIYSKDLKMEYAGWPLAQKDSFQECEGYVAGNTNSTGVYHSCSEK